MRLFGWFRAPAGPKATWVATGEYRWITQKSGCGMKIQALYARDVCMDTCDERWEAEYYQWDYYGGYTREYVNRIVPSETSDEYTGHPSIDQRPTSRDVRRMSKQA